MASIQDLALFLIAMSSFAWVEASQLALVKWAEPGAGQAVWAAWPKVTRDRTTGVQSFTAVRAMSHLPMSGWREQDFTRAQGKSRGHTYTEPHINKQPDQGSNACNIYHTCTHRIVSTDMLVATDVQYCQRRHSCTDRNTHTTAAQTETYTHTTEAGR